MGAQDTTYEQKYRGNVRFLLEERRSLLRGAVTEMPMTGERMFFDDFGSIELVEKTTRAPPTPEGTISHERRAIYSRSYHNALMIDWSDMIRYADQVDSPYSQALSGALNRAMDDVIIGALGGTAYKGKDGTETVSYDTGMTVGVQVNMEGQSTDLGLNVAKILRAKRFLDENNNDPNEAAYLMVNPRQLESLLQSTKATSQDFARVKSLVDGEINYWAGFNFIRTNDVPTESDGDDKLFFWKKSGIYLAVGKQPTIEITKRADRSFATQLYAALDIGAVRMNEKKVGYIRCDPATGPGTE
jgi:hypothetical protein